MSDESYPQLPPSAHLPLPDSPPLPPTFNMPGGESSGTSGKNPEFSFSKKVREESIDKPTTVKLDNITPLSGQSNYNVWASTMKIILKGMNCYEIVVEGLEPSIDADSKERKAYDYLSYPAQTIFIQVVTNKILEKIVELETPHKMWTWLRTEYY